MCSRPSRTASCAPTPRPSSRAKERPRSGASSELRIRRVHADLRSDAVCFTNGICVFDCVEFNRRINVLDVARDTGFLAMDLKYRGHDGLAADFTRAYLAAAQ